jgi:hypothetical protein
MPIFAALVPAAIGGVTSLAGALIGKSGGDKQAATEREAMAEQRALAQPYVGAGMNALGQYQNALGINGAAGNQAATDAYLNSPLYRMTYQPAYDEAAKAVTRYGSANGTLNSGRTLMALQDRAARIGQQTFGSYVNSLGDLATRGQNAAFGQGTNIQTGTNALNSAYGAGNDALAAGVIGAGNAVQSGFNNYNYANALAKYRAPTMSAYGG